MSKEISQLEANTRKLVTKSKNALNFIKSELENDYPPDELTSIGLYVDTIESLRLIEELEKELTEISNKRVSPKLKQIEIPY